MAAPNRVGSRETVWTTTDTPKVTTDLAVTTGDIVVAVYIHANPTPGTVTTGASSTATTAVWVQQVMISQANNCEVELWTTTVTGNGNLQVSFAAESGIFGGFVTVWNASDGLGTVTPNTTYGTGACAVSFDPTATATDSAIVMGVGDWSASAVAAVLTNMGAFTEVERSAVGADYSVYAGYHVNCGRNSAANIGVNSTALTWALVAIEVRGQAGGGVSTKPGMTVNRGVARGINRGAVRYPTKR